MDNSTKTFSRKCPLCGNMHDMDFNTQDLEDGMKKYHAGELIQKAFPTFTPEQREFIKTGICDTCWNSMR